MHFSKQSGARAAYVGQPRTLSCRAFLFFFFLHAYSASPSVELSFPLRLSKKKIKTDRGGQEIAARRITSQYAKYREAGGGGGVGG